MAVPGARALYLFCRAPGDFPLSPDRSIRSVITRFQFLNVIAFVLLLSALVMLQSGSPERANAEEAHTPVRPRSTRESGGGDRNTAPAEQAQAQAKTERRPGKSGNRSTQADERPAAANSTEVAAAAAAHQEQAVAAAPRPGTPWSRHAALFTRPEAEPFRAVDPVQPGNSLPVAGGRVFIESHRAAAAGTTSPELEVSFSKDAPASSDGQLQTSPSAARQRADIRPGLTYEQELFRTKWGWVAYDLSQRAGSELGAEQ